MDDLSLSSVELSIAASLLLVNVALSWYLRLDMGRKILGSASRMVVQLMLLGLVLKSIFAIASFGPVMLLATTMTLIAGWSAVGRVENHYVGIRSNVIVSVWASSWLVTAVAIFAVVRPDPWYSPQIAIPLLGMVLGNSLTGISLGTDRFIAELTLRRHEVDMQLSLGATRWEATREIFRIAMKSAMIPILNTMSVAGVVSLPGMMTGQLLAGANPMVAVKYQVMIMFVIASAIAMGVFLAIALTFFRVTTPDHQLRLPRC